MVYAVRNRKRTERRSYKYTKTLLERKKYKRYYILKKVS